jgi:hypothetical protein
VKKIKTDDSSFYDFSDDKIMGNVKKDKNPPVEKDPEKVLDSYLNGTPEIEKQTSDNNGVNNTKKLPKTDIFSVIDPKDKQEKSKNLQSDNPLVNSEPKNIKTNDELTTEIENLLDKDVDIVDKGTDIDAIEATLPPASPPKENTNQAKINPESDMPSALDTTDIADEQKNTTASDDIISSIDTLISENNAKDLTDSVPDALQDKLSLPSKSFEISRLSTSTTEETGIIPTDNIMEENPSRNQDIPIIQDKEKTQDTKVSLKQPDEEADADTKKIIDLENQDFNCRFEHSIDTVEQTEIFKLMLMPILQTQKPIKMQVKQKLQLYQYLNMDLEDIDNYPSEFSVLRHFCKTMTVQKSVSEDY